MIALLAPAEQNQISTVPDWAAQFASAEKVALSTTVSEPIAEPSTSTITVDDLAATAGLLISSVQHETNLKFQNSEFMGLMRRLRDRQAIVDGDTIVERDDSSSSAPLTATTAQVSNGWQDEFATSMLDKGKARAVEHPTVSLPTVFGPVPSTTTYNVAPGFYDSIAARGINPSTYSHVLAQELQGATPLSTSASAPQQQQDLTDYFDNLALEDEFEEGLLGKDYLLNNDAINGAQHYAELARIQADMDSLDDFIIEAESSLDTGYQFQSRNPYVENGALQNVLHPAHHALPYQVRPHLFSLSDDQLRVSLLTLITLRSTRM